MTKTPYSRENVCIYANARFWEEIIGRDSIIGNAWITKSIPPRSLVTNTTTTEVKVKLRYGATKIIRPDWEYAFNGKCKFNQKQNKTFIEA
jgi:hypothetical protein